VTTPAPVDNPTEPTSTRWGLLRLVLFVAAAAALFFALGWGDLFLVIVVIVLMVVGHEFGHFATAKWSRMKVTEFFVGFGPRLWSVRRGETEYGVKAIPAGGYVKIPGMTNLEEIDPADEPRTYRRQPFHNRIIVALAGSTMHFVMAFLLAWAALVFIGGQSSSAVVINGFSRFDGQATNPAQRAGLTVGDRIVGVNGHRLTDETQLLDAIGSSVGTDVHLLVDRGGRLRTITVVPENRNDVTIPGETTPTGPASGVIGVELGSVNVRENPFGALGGAGVVIGRTTAQAFGGLGQVFSPHGLSSYVHEVANSNAARQDQQTNAPRPESIIGAARAAVQGAQAGSGYLIEVLIALNIFIAIVNLIPMLPLDGGHVAIAVYERIRTRRGRPYYQADAAKLMPVAYGFLALLILLATSAAYLDITHPAPNPFG
jgi:membrane-associated protease RseP (regulator of RpoE activity)